MLFFGMTRNYEKGSNDMASFFSGISEYAETKKENQKSLLVKLFRKLKKLPNSEKATEKQKRLFGMLSTIVLPQLLARCQNGVIWRKFESIFSKKASNSNMKKLHSLKPCVVSQEQAVGDAMKKVLEHVLSGKFPSLIETDNINNAYVIAFFVRFSANCLRGIVLPRQVDDDKKAEIAKKDEKATIEVVIVSETMKDFTFDILKKLSETFTFDELQLWGKSVQGGGKKAFSDWKKGKSVGYVSINSVNIVVKDFLGKIDDRFLRGRVAREVVNSLTT
jgi:hypothetical protein